MKYKYRFILMFFGLLVASIEPATEEANIWLFWTIVVKLIGIGMCYFGATYKTDEA